MKGSRKEIHETIHFALLSGIAFLLPFSVKITSILIIVCLFNWLVEGHIYQKLKGSFSDRMNVLWVLLFVLHLLSIIISENKAEAFAIIERRLSFLIFPLFFWKPVSKEQVRNIALTFLIGVFVALVACYFYAISHYFKYHDASLFYYHKFSGAIRIHAVYLAAYAVFGIHILWQYTAWGRPFIRTISIVGSGFLIISCYLLSSKMLLFVLLLGSLLKVILSVRIAKFKKALLGFALIVLSIAGVWLLPQVRQRFDFEIETKWQALKVDELPDSANLTGTSFRLLVWKHTIEIVQQQKAWLMGVGIGDFQDLLNKRYEESGMYIGNSALNDRGYLGYNAHNQYIELLISIGIIGVLTLLLLITLLFQKAFNTNNMLLFQLAIIFVFFSMSESVLATNKGVVFFLLFFCLMSREIKDPKLLS